MGLISAQKLGYISLKSKERDLTNYKCEIWPEWCKLFIVNFSWTYTKQQQKLFEKMAHFPNFHQNKIK